MTRYSFILTSMFLFLLSSCATYEPIYKKENTTVTTTTNKKTPVTSFYLIGDAGNANLGESTDALNAFSIYISEKNTENDYLLFLGDNIYEDGFTEESVDEMTIEKHRINVQLEAAQKFEGETIFIPGNHDWYSDGLKGLKRQEKYIEKILKNKEAFKPENGCGFEKIKISDDIVLLVIDTQWYLSDWDKHPTINDNCTIKTRNDFFLEIENELKKSTEKTTVIAMHHPAYTNGSHGGYFNARKHLFPFKINIPLPGIGSLVTLVRSQGGVSNQDVFNSRYEELMTRLTTLVKGSERIVFVSGHEHSLQYINHNGVKQIVSGAGSKSTPVSLGSDGIFSYGRQGFSVFNVFDDGSTSVQFFSTENGLPKLIFETEVEPAIQDYDTSNLSTTFETKKNVSAYPKEITDKSKTYEWFWGDHYRYVYGTNLSIPIATLDTLYGGLTIERKGGGHQTRSLRLIDNKGRNFALRGIKKSAVRFLQSVVFKDTYVEEGFRDTVVEDLFFDFYTSSHPYATFVIGDLSDAIGLYHTNPQLFYIPKHTVLGNFNDEFGDELYIIEERPDDGFLDVNSFGNPDDIVSTSDVLENLREDEKYRVDHASFIKARLFDMLIGDWDRHDDQWRWAEFNVSKNEVVYKPIPRDRDQAFSNYDGALLDFLKVIVPSSRQFQKFDANLKDVKWINIAGIKIDRAFTQTASKEEWLKQANFIRENLSDKIIDEAFLNLPEEINDEVSAKIKENLKQRRENIVDIAMRYYEYLSRLVIITGTDKDDFFEIIRENNKTTISVSRIKKGKIETAHKSRALYSNETKEIWVYGLDDDDRFEVKGTGTNPIFIRIIGGQNNDVYAIDNGKKVKIYDYKTKPNTIEKRGGANFKLSNRYSSNTYNFRNFINKTNSILPSIGFNPDDGMILGLSDAYIIKGFENELFKQKHLVNAGYYFATQGFDIKYSGEYTNVFGRWSLLIGAQFASESFTQNFFGFGNDTVNFDDLLDLDYNRVKTGKKGLRIGFAKNGFYGSRFTAEVVFEAVEIEETPNRFISNFYGLGTNDFKTKNFGGLDFMYKYESKDNSVNPSRGMTFIVETGFRTNFDNTSRSIGFLKPSIEFYNALSKNKRLVLRTEAQGHFILGNSFEIYQSAQVGANTGLRGYRAQRYAGNHALAFSGDLRYSFKQFKTGFLPLQMGIFGGYDYGRVWLDDESSRTWHDSVGGGFWINAIDTLSGQFGVFNSDEGLRFSFGFAMGL